MVKVDGSGTGKSLIQVRDLDKTYRRAGEEIHVLQGLNLDVAAGSSWLSWAPAGRARPRC